MGNEDVQREEHGWKSFGRLIRYKGNDQVGEVLVFAPWSPAVCTGATELAFAMRRGSLLMASCRFDEIIDEMLFGWYLVVMMVLLSCQMTSEKRPAHRRSRGTVIHTPVQSNNLRGCCLWSIVGG